MYFDLKVPHANSFMIPLQTFKITRCAVALNNECLLLNLIAQKWNVNQNCCQSLKDGSQKSMIHYMLVARIGSPTQLHHAVRLQMKVDATYLVLSSIFQIGPMVTATRRILTSLKIGNGAGRMKH